MIIKVEGVSVMVETPGIRARFRLRGKPTHSIVRALCSEYGECDITSLLHMPDRTFTFNKFGHTATMLTLRSGKEITCTFDAEPDIDGLRTLHLPTSIRDLELLEVVSSVDYLVLTDLEDEDNPYLIERAYREGIDL